MDFIYFDLVFAFIWIVVLLYRNYKIELKLGIFGFIFIYLLDGIIWFHLLGTRQVETPFSPNMFMIYFSFTYGIIEFSFVRVMFHSVNKRERLFWTIFLYTGWIFSAVFSQMISIDDRMIMVQRDMSLFRFWQVIFTILGYLILYLLKFYWRGLEHINLKKISSLFLVGFLVHFGMEISFFLSKIRPTNDFPVLVFNSLIEFNMGIPVLYIIWLKLNQTRI